MKTSVVYLKRSLLCSPGKQSTWRRNVLDMCLRIASRSIVHRTKTGDAQIAELIRRHTAMPVDIEQDLPEWSLLATLGIWKVCKWVPSLKYQTVADMVWRYARYGEAENAHQWAAYRAKNNDFVAVKASDLHDIMEARRQIWQPTNASPPGVGDLLVQESEDGPGKAGIVLSYDSYTNNLLVLAVGVGKVSLANGMYGNGIGFASYHVKDEYWDWAIAPSVVDFSPHVEYFSDEAEAEKFCKRRNK